MRNSATALAGMVFLLGVVAAWAQPYQIASPDEQKIFYGTPASFEKPAEVDYRQVVMATPEYASIKKNKIKSGTAKYWILVSEGSQRAVRAIKEVGTKGEFDLIAAKGYLGSLKPPIPAEDVTELVLKRLDEEG